MKKNFIWQSNFEESQVEDIEILISKVIEERNLVPCHLNQLDIILAITGPLDNILEGQILCTCKKVIMKFEGSSDGSKLTLEENL